MIVQGGHYGGFSANLANNIGQIGIGQTIQTQSQNGILDFWILGSCGGYCGNAADLEINGSQVTPLFAGPGWQHQSVPVPAGAVNFIFWVGNGVSVFIDDVSYTAPLVQCSTPTATWTSTPVPSTSTLTNTPTATATTCGGYRILIVYADGQTPPATLRNELLAQPDVSTVDLFDAGQQSPTLAQLTPYQIVVAFSGQAPYADPVTLGTTLADYQDAGGIVIANYGSFSDQAGYGLSGRWQSGGYSPVAYSTTTLSSGVSLGAYQAGHPLMAGVSTLNAVLRRSGSPAPGATQVATYTDGSPAVVYKTTNGHTSVGLPAYLGEGSGRGTGDYASVIVNAGRWLAQSLCPTPTAVPTDTLTPTPSNTP